MTNSLRKILALIAVPFVAVLTALLLGFLQDFIITVVGDLRLHDEWYIVPDLLIYSATALALGFLPALLLRRKLGMFLAALISPLAVAAIELIQLEINGLLGTVSATSVLLNYFVAWSFANLAGLAVWGKST